MTAGHPPGARCASVSCRTVAAYAVRTAGNDTWTYACGWHIARTIRDRASGHRVIVETLS